ncbi:hypothetical protein AT959_10370 [Dechloromonas denitrificans]|uniref:Uncharacterized protein n=1 Tax=Dechloromonas denitrificans TaxID=281362 RepID=A0A133XJH8_9RHOO|nr:hypothetical protein [Dechloromonas denitrificans]KXB31089.1 hypothetical protein AT959_10370 [Dechloromonas denitrificans]
MADIPEKDLEETRAALAPTLEATAAILPWVAKPRPLRFAEALNERWIAACRNLATAWSARHHAETDSVRPAVFALYGIALESADTDCLRLGEALASAADGLEGVPPARLIAALSATIECFDEASGLEHVLFAERARHFAERLEGCLSPGGQALERSPVLDRLFVSEARERLERLHDALAALPLDAYALKIEAGELAQQAEHLELYGILHLCHQLLQAIPSQGGIDQQESATVRQGLLAILHQLETTIAAVDA